MAHVLEIDSSRPKGKAVWYKPLNAEIKRELQRFGVGDHVIVRLRIGTSGVHDTIVKVTTALETHGPALANGASGKPGKKARKTGKQRAKENSLAAWADIILPTTADRAEIARQEAEIAKRPAHSGYLAEDEDTDKPAKTGKKSRRGLQPDRTDPAQREDALARLKDTARENVFTGPNANEPKPVRLDCPFCNGPKHDTQDQELLCMNATRFSRKRRRNRGTERATDDDE